MLPDAPAITHEPTVVGRGEPPSIGRALREAASDVYFNSWRIVPWNALWAVGLIAGLLVWSVAGPFAAALVAAVLAVPIAALARLGGLAVRGRDVNFSDGWDLVRQRAVAVVGAGALFVVTLVVFVVNLVTGLAIGGPVGWGLATLAAWGLVGTVAYGFAFWPLLADPDRDGCAARDLARLAGLLVIAYPRRLGGLTLVLALLLAVSTALFAVLLTVAVGFVLVVACRFVLPAADRLEARLAARMTSTPR